MLKLFLTLLLLAFLGACTAEPDPVLDAPENAYWHADSETWFVSSLGGGLSLKTDGYGWVSRFDALGKVIAAAVGGWHGRADRDGFA